MDDDVDTDDEIMKNALTACRNDFQDTKYKLAQFGWRAIVNNMEINRRAKNPEDYDRNGKFIGYERKEPPVFHPSMAEARNPATASSVVTRR